jgi:hypothetical protein
MEYHQWAFAMRCHQWAFAMRCHRWAFAMEFARAQMGRSQVLMRLMWLMDPN